MCSRSTLEEEDILSVSSESDFCGICGSVDSGYCCNRWAWCPNCGCQVCRFCSDNQYDTGSDSGCCGSSDPPSPARTEDDDDESTADDESLLEDLMVKAAANTGEDEPTLQWDISNQENEEMIEWE
jgi:hypothetical protein